PLRIRLPASKPMELNENLDSVPGFIMNGLDFIRLLLRNSYFCFWIQRRHVLLNKNYFWSRRQELKQGFIHVNQRLRLGDYLRGIMRYHFLGEGDLQEEFYALFRGHA
ncbi:hypothetical protein GOP47_0031081, partial [Adiantum capillus-veneris]